MCELYACYVASGWHADEVNASGTGTAGADASCVQCLQVASVMGLMSVALDLLLLIHPMSNAQDELKEMISSKQDLKNDMQELEAAGFLKPCKETPDSWDFAQVTLCFPYPVWRLHPNPPPSPFPSICLF